MPAFPLLIWGWASCSAAASTMFSRLSFPMKKILTWNYVELVAAEGAVAVSVNLLFGINSFVETPAHTQRTLTNKSILQFKGKGKGKYCCHSALLYKPTISNQFTKSHFSNSQFHRFTISQIHKKKCRVPFSAESEHSLMTWVMSPPYLYFSVAN